MNPTNWRQLGSLSTYTTVLKSGDESRPLFLFHPVGGDVHFYVPLCQALNIPYAVLAFPQFRTREDEKKSFKDMARLYHKYLKFIQPNGPYTLLGWSMGGFFAHEIASYIEKEGSTISYLGLIDSHIIDHSIPSKEKHYTFLKEYFEKMCLQNSLDCSLPNESSLLDEEELVKLIAKTLKERLDAKKGGKCGIELTTFLEIYSKISHNYGALLNHTPPTLSTSFDFFYAVDKIEDDIKPCYKNWQETTQGVCSFYPYVADHYSILAKPVIDAIATQIEAKLL